MKLVENFLNENPCYRAAQKMEVKGLMLHSVGCPQPKAAVFLKNWNKASYKRACVHAFIDGNDGTVYQTLPWDFRGWHCGGAGNDSYIGVEMCEPSQIQYVGGTRFICLDEDAAKESAKRTYESSVELFAYLCKQYSLNPLANGVILSHAEAHTRGFASNHGDPQHLWDGLNLGYTMDGFRRDVKEKLAVLVGENESNPSKEQTSVKDLDYLVRVQIPDLNIRKGPGTNYAKTGDYTGLGTFTIVDEANGVGAAKWGKLKSGAGWISLDYAERVE